MLARKLGTAIAHMLRLELFSLLRLLVNGARAHWSLELALLGDILTGDREPWLVPLRQHCWPSGQLGVSTFGTPLSWDVHNIRRLSTRAYPLGGGA